MRLLPVAELLAVRADARERMAREVFDINTVSARMTEVAATGAEGMRIVQPLPRDLRGTRGAAKLEKWLQDGGYGIRWVEMPRQCKDGQLAAYWEMVVCWVGDVDGLT